MMSLVPNADWGPSTFKTLTKRSRNPIALMQRKQVHREGDGDVDKKARVDALGPHGQRAERNPGDDGSGGLQVWFAVVDHAVRHAHREDCARAQAVTQT